MHELLDKIKNDQANNLPDVLETSSIVLQEIFSNHLQETTMPHYIKRISLRNYFYEKITSASTIDMIKKAWKINPKSFKKNLTLNELSYCVGENFEANRILKQLPENLTAKKVGPSIVMKLDEAQNFFGIRFGRNSLFALRR